MVEWKNDEARSRLIAAIIASLGNQKLNYRDIAKFFGKGATYDAIENQFRAYRKEAEKLKDEASKNEDAPPATASRRSKKERSTVSANTTHVQKSKNSGRGSIPKKTPQPSVSVGGHGINSTLGGRISKSKSKSPTDLYGENALRAIKDELSEPADFTGFGGDGADDLDIPEMSFEMFDDTDYQWAYYAHNSF